MHNSTKRSRESTTDVTPITITEETFISPTVHSIGWLQTLLGLGVSFASAFNREESKKLCDPDKVPYTMQCPLYVHDPTDKDKAKWGHADGEHTIHVSHPGFLLYSSEESFRASLCLRKFDQHALWVATDGRYASCADKFHADTVVTHVGYVMREDSPLGGTWGDEATELITEESENGNQTTDPSRQRIIDKLEIMHDILPKIATFFGLGDPTDGDETQTAVIQLHILQCLRFFDQLSAILTDRLSGEVSVVRVLWNGHVDENFNDCVFPLAMQTGKWLRPRTPEEVQNTLYMLLHLYYNLATVINFIAPDEENPVVTEPEEEDDDDDDDEDDDEDDY